LEINRGTADYFSAQLEWLSLLASEPPKSWVDKGLAVTPVTTELLGRSRRTTDQ